MCAVDVQYLPISVHEPHICAIDPVRRRRRSVNWPQALPRRRQLHQAHTGAVGGPVSQNRAPQLRMCAVTRKRKPTDSASPVFSLHETRPQNTRRASASVRSHGSGGILDIGGAVSCIGQSGRRLLRGDRTRRRRTAASNGGGDCRVPSRARARALGLGAHCSCLLFRCREPARTPASNVRGQPG